MTNRGWVRGLGLLLSACFLMGGIMGFLNLVHERTGQTFSGRLWKVSERENQVQLVGLWEVNGKKYYFDRDGEPVKGWVNVSEGERYYADEEGTIVTGRKKIQGITYEFDENGKLLREDAGNVKMVALTFDDGPSRHTDRILDVLARYDAAATFFVVGNRAADFEQVLRRERELDCQIGSHSYSHRYLNSLSYGELSSELSRTDEAVEAAIGERTTCLRPPGGFFDKRVAALVDCPIAMWSVDTLDWKTKDPQDVYRRATEHVENGDVILMHDLYESTAEAVERIVPELIRQGYRLVTFSELMNASGGAFAGKAYYHGGW